MMKIEISYEQPQELYKALEQLKPIIRSYKVKKAGNGADRRYNKAYIKCQKLIIDTDTNAQKSIDKPLI